MSTSPVAAPDLAARLGAYCWIEQRLFTGLDRWAALDPRPEAVVTFTTLAAHAAWRARRWYELLPTAPPGPDALVAVDRTVADVFEILDRSPGEVDGAAAIDGLMAAFGEILAAHRVRSGPVAERPILRILRINADDLELDRIALAPLVGGAGTPPDPGEAARRLVAVLGAI